MQLQFAIKNLFTQINDSLDQLSARQYTMPIDTLFDATIGQHIRHVVELFIELNKGYETGIVNYENRKRDYRLETDKTFAASLMEEISQALNKPDKQLILEANYDEFSTATVAAETNYIRELVYNLEHTVHHMALIRIGINKISGAFLPKDYGVASSTVRHRKAMMQ